MSRHDLSHQLELLVGLVVTSRFPEESTIRLVGIPYSQEGLFNAERIFLFLGGGPPGRGNLMWLASLSWFHAFTTGNPLLGTNLLEASVGRDFGALV